MSTIVDIREVAARTKIAVQTTGRWQATRLHKRETREENARHNTNAAKVMVRVSNHQALTDLSKLHAEAYGAHRRLTLPSVQEGMRILPAGREFEHADLMRKFADRHNALVKSFLADYDAEKAAAPVRLNGLYDPSMWPSHDEVARKFKFQTRYLAVPTDGEWADWLQASTEAAEAELRERLTETLERVRDRAKSDGKLYASVFDAVRDLAALVPDLDFTGDYAPVVAAMEPLTKVHAEQLRDDPQGRQEVAKQAASILSVLGGVK